MNVWELADSDYRRCWHKTQTSASPAILVFRQQKRASSRALWHQRPNQWWLSARAPPDRFPGHPAQQRVHLHFADGHAETRRWREPNTMNISSRNSWLVLQQERH
jgi:hypothetical protein